MTTAPKIAHETSCVPADPLDRALIAELLPDTLRARIEVTEPVDSTQRVLLAEMAQRPDRAVVLSGHQTAGRGRRGRTWLAPAGATLAVSILARAQTGRRWAPNIGLALGVAAAEVLQACAGADVGLKWPNDLVVAGRKLGGILIEAQGATIVAGVGINVSLPESTRTRIDQPCVDLHELGCRLRREHLAAALVQAWNTALDTFDAAGFEAFHARWDALDLLRGQAVQVLAGPSDTCIGLACGVDGDGRLRVEVDGRIRVFTSAEISVRPA